MFDIPEDIREGAPLNLQNSEAPLFLGTQPHGFRVAYAINDHMDDGKFRWFSNPARYLSVTRDFWRTAVKHLTSRGAQMIRSTPDPRQADGIFAADLSIVFIDEEGQRRALMSKMRHGERRDEVAHWRRALRFHKFVTTESECLREGSGDSLFDPNFGIWWTGVGKRTDVGAGRQQSEVTGRPVIEIKTVDGHFYHIDTFLSFLPNGHAVLFKDAMSEADYAKLCRFYPDDKRLELTRQEALALGANLQFIATGDTHAIFTPHDCPPRLADALKGWGYEVEPVDVRGVRLAGGGMHCCFQRVWDLRQYPLRELPQAFSQLLQSRGESQIGFWAAAVKKPAPKPQKSLQKAPELV